VLVTDEGVRALGAAPALASVDLSCCRRVTDEGVRALMAAPALAHVKLTYCKRVTAKCKRALGVAHVSAMEAKEVVRE
jgi:hypothetical protein